MYTPPQMFSLMPNHGPIKEKQKHVIFKKAKPIKKLKPIKKKKVDPFYTKKEYLDYGYQKDDWCNHEFYEGEINSDIVSYFFTSVFNKYIESNNPYIYSTWDGFEKCININYNGCYCKIGFRNKLYINYSYAWGRFFRKKIIHKDVFEFTLLAIFTLADNQASEFLEFFHRHAINDYNIGFELRHRIVRLLPVFRDNYFTGNLETKYSV